MNYIGSKLSLIDFLDESIHEVTSEIIKSKKDIVFADGFAGTGIVGVHFKKLGYSVLSNDVQFYSYARNKHLIENCYDDLNMEKIKWIMIELNALDLKPGFISRNYAIFGTKGKTFERMYFTDNNALRIDTYRKYIEELKTNGRINEQEYFFLISSLVESADKVANTASVYGAYLKKYKKSALNDLKFNLLDVYDFCNHNNSATNMKIEDWIMEVEGDILYLDPPYNQRQYGTNYHMLETIAKYDDPVIKGKTGLREYSDVKSDWCSKSKVEKVFEELISKAKFKFVFLSYNNEGLMSLETIEKIMEKYGDYELKKKEYRRFKADKTENRNHKANSTFEYLHCLTKK